MEILISSVASNLGLHGLPITLLQWVKQHIFLCKLIQFIQSNLLLPNQSRPFHEIWSLASVKSSSPHRLVGILLPLLLPPMRSSKHLTPVIVASHGKFKTHCSHYCCHPWEVQNTLLPLLLPPMGSSKHITFKTHCSRYSCHPWEVQNTLPPLLLPPMRSSKQFATHEKFKTHCSRYC